MTWKIKTLIAGFVLLIIVVMGFIIKLQYDNNQRLKMIESSVIESKDIGNGIIRSQSNYVTKKDFETVAKELNLNLSTITKDLDKFNAEAKGINTVIVKTPGGSKANQPSSSITPNPSPDQVNTNKLDEFGYLSNTQWFELTEPINNDTVIPFGNVGFSAWQEKPWSVNITPRTYSSTTVIGEDEDGRTFSYNTFQVEVNGVKYKVPITEAKMIEKYPNNQFYFNPKLFLGLNGGVIVNPLGAELVPDISMSIFSYGKTKADSTWSFLNIGIGYATQEKAPVVLVAPVNYNIGENLPIINNLFIGPGISLDVKGNIGLYAGVRVGL